MEAGNRQAADSGRACSRSLILFAWRMDWTGRRIEIFAPFGEAFELMEKILLRPFDVGKWFVIGFAAWLATFFGGFNFNYRYNLRDHEWPRHFDHHRLSLENAPSWLLPAAIVGGLFLLGLIVLFVWLNSRGRFMFIDCLVHNRGAIVAPWKEFRVEANRYFVFRLVVSLCSLIVFGGLAVVAFLTLRKNHAVPLIAVIVLLAVILALIAIVIALITIFMVPVMYRQRCTALSAFGQVWSLIKARPGAFILLCLFYLLLYIAGAMVSCLVTCATCCLTLIPYLGTVILLPVVVVLYAFPLCFLRQFGDPYDVWSGVPAESSQAAPGPTAPPLPEPPSSLAAPPLQQPPPLPPSTSRPTEPPPPPSGGE